MLQDSGQWPCPAQAVAVATRAGTLSCLHCLRTNSLPLQALGGGSSRYFAPWVQGASGLACCRGPYSRQASAKSEREREREREHEREQEREVAFAGHWGFSPPRNSFHDSQRGGQLRDSPVRAPQLLLHANSQCLSCCPALSGTVFRSCALTLYCYETPAWKFCLRRGRSVQSMGWTVSCPGRQATVRFTLPTLCPENVYVSILHHSHSPEQQNFTVTVRKESQYLR